MFLQSHITFNCSTSGEEGLSAERRLRHQRIGTVNLQIQILTWVLEFIGGCTVGQTPLNVIQMLWTNLIMDSFGAIALGTEPSSDG